MDFVRALMLSLVRAACIGLVLLAIAAFFNTAKAADQGQAWVSCKGYEASGTYANTACYDYPSESTVKLQVIPGGSGQWTYQSFTYNGTCLNGPYRAELPTDFTYSTSPPSCIDGCKVNHGPYTQVTVNGTVTSQGEERAYTGDVCTAVSGEPEVTAEEAADEPEESCVPAGSGQTFCLKPDGRQCTTASTGVTFCWTTDQQGSQVDGDQAQTRRSEDRTVAPPTATTEDEEWDRSEGHQATACVNSTCTTYNVTNWNSVPVGTGDPGDGSGEESSEGAGDGELGTGFGNPSTKCGEPPSCGGEDAIGCAMLKQHYNLACKVSDEEGTEGVPEGPADAEVMADPNTIFGDSSDDDPDVDFSGWGATGTCPVVLSFSVPRFGSYTMDGEWICHVLDAMRILINLLAGIHAGFIIASGLRKS